MNHTAIIAGSLCIFSIALGTASFLRGKKSAVTPFCIITAVFTLIITLTSLAS